MSSSTLTLCSHPEQKIQPDVANSWQNLSCVELVEEKVILLNIIRLFKVHFKDNFIKFLFVKLMNSFMEDNHPS